MEVITSTVTLFLVVIFFWAIDVILQKIEENNARKELESIKRGLREAQTRMKGNCYGKRWF